MSKTLLALAVVSLALAAPVLAKQPTRAVAGARRAPVALLQKSSRKNPTPQKPSPQKPSVAAPDIEASPTTTRVADWVAASGDNDALPYAIVDKSAATVFLFDRTGKALGAAPVLIGVAIGDDATPGIGSKNLAEIGPAEKTTPAGRYLAKFGLAAGKQKVLWVDYATSVGLHPIPPTSPKSERRRERMLSPDPEDHRITFGCINVPSTFYKRVSPLFAKKGGYVYVLPDTRPIEDVFPRLVVQEVANAGHGDGGVEQAVALR